MKILFIGDIVGKPGRKIIKEQLLEIKKDLKIDFTIANAENAAGGIGVTSQAVNELYDSGIDIITLGNHVWDKKDILDFIDIDEKIVRPGNFPRNVPGKGYRITNKSNLPAIAVVNLQGRVFMNPLDCPFKVSDEIIDKIKDKTNIIIVDFHAEATSEKNALGYYLDGKISAFLGTHTHIQTADERILPKGTAYITDVGMTGPYESILGIKKENVIKRFLTQMPNRFEVATGKTQINAVCIEIDNTTGKSSNIERVYYISE